MNSKVRTSLDMLQHAYENTIERMNLLGACVFPKKLSDQKLIDYAGQFSDDLKNNKSKEKEIAELKKIFEDAFKDFKNNSKKKLILTIFYCFNRKSTI